MLVLLLFVGPSSQNINRIRRGEGEFGLKKRRP